MYTLFLLTNDGQKVHVCSRYSVPVFEVLGLHLSQGPSEKRGTLAQGISILMHDNVLKVYMSGGTSLESSATETDGSDHAKKQ